MQETFFLEFHLGERRFALTAQQVVEICWLPAITPQDDVPPYLAGLVNFHGQLVPVLDLAARLNHPPQPWRVTDSLIFLRQSPAADAPIVALHATEVSDVWADSQEGWAHPTLSTHLSDLIVGERQHEEGIVAWLNTQALFSLAPPPADTPPPELPPLSAFGYLDGLSAAQRDLLEARRQRLHAPIGVADSTGAIAVALVQLGGETLGIAVESVCEFTFLQTISPIPCCPSHILGNVNLRGEIIVLIDIRALLNLPQTATLQHAVILETPSLGRIAIAIEEVSEVRYVDPAARRPMPYGIEATQERHLAELIRVNERDVARLDMAHILASPALIVNQEV